MKDNGQPFSLAFNVAVMAMAARVLPAGYDVEPDAAKVPASLPELCAYIARTGRIVVWAGASDDTIFGDREHNWAFRAWHDWTHAAYGYAFDERGERATAEAQIDDLRKVFGAGFAARYAPYIREEVIGQAHYYHAHGGFPETQRTFARAYLGAVGAPIEG